MKTTNKFILVLLTLFVLSCEDVFEDNISDDTIYTISPKEDTTIESNVVNFQWNNLDGAKKYRLQVLDKNESIVLDSLVSKTSLNCPLLPGTYKWKVRGENFGYESRYSDPTTFSMVVSNDLSNQQVVLSSPDSNMYRNNTNVTLKWHKLAAATSYKVEVLNTTTGETVYTAENIIETSVPITSNITKDGKYLWKVKGVNSTSETLQFSTRTFMIDTVVPNLPQNSLPANNAVVTKNVATAYSWVSLADTGTAQSPLIHTIEFSTTNTFTSIFFTTNNSTTTYQHTLTTAGDYYWRIKTSDAAGNVSAYSAPFKVTVI